MDAESSETSIYPYIDVVMMIVIEQKRINYIPTCCGLTDKGFVKILC